MHMPKPQTSEQSPLRTKRRTVLMTGLATLLTTPWRSAFSAAVDGDVWPKKSSVPGGVTRLPLGFAVTQPMAFAGDIPLRVIGDPIAWTALVGIALSAEPGEANITVRSADGTERTITYTIAPKSYREQRLRVHPR